MTASKSSRLPGAIAHTSKSGGDYTDLGAFARLGWAIMRHEGFAYVEGRCVGGGERLRDDEIGRCKAHEHEHGEARHDDARSRFREHGTEFQRVSAHGRGADDHRLPRHRDERERPRERVRRPREEREVHDDERDQRHDRESHRNG